MLKIRVINLPAMIVFLLLTNGCHFGVTAKKYPAAQGPKGVTMAITTQQGQFSGELIEVRDTGLIVLTIRELRLVPYGVIISSALEQTDSRYAISNGRAPEPDVREHIRLLSRFPQGLTPDLLHQLLQVYGQSELAGVNP